MLSDYDKKEQYKPVNIVDIVHDAISCHRDLISRKNLSAQIRLLEGSFELPLSLLLESDPLSIILMSVLG
jgi:Zn-finger domain-containing protein